MTGGTGYVGRRLAEMLLSRGHRVQVLTRPASVTKVPPGAEPVIGDALDAASFVEAVGGRTTLVHLVGTPHPSPAKAAAFRRVDPPRLYAFSKFAISAACRAGGPLPRRP
jgi:uncharacterized protein YbjT (DUF2867 family)